jgi:hypothetical protein
VAYLTDTDIVLNGQRIVQHEQEGQWQDNKVEKAGTVKPGIYSLYLASQVDKAKRHDGVILHADKDAVYQQAGKSFIKHDRENFDKVPEIGKVKTIAYEHGRA